MHLLDKLNVKTFNSHKSISVCDDKGETYIELSGKGFNLPKTQFAPLCYSQECEISEQYVISLEQNIGYPMIAKSSYGSCGSGVYKIDNRKELIKIMQQLKTIPHMYQQYLGKHVGKDIRVIVIGGKAVASMQRYNPNDFRSNLALGGVGTKIEVNDKKYAKVISTSQKVSKVLGLDYCGVDILLGDDDKPYICEVNSNAFFEGIEKVTSVNVAEKYVEHILNNI